MPKERIYKTYLDSNPPPPEPNPVQLEFMRLAAEKYHYVGLGDTNHSIPELKMFVLHPDALNALSKGGVKTFFLEQKPSRQKDLDRLMKDKKTPFTPGNSHLDGEGLVKLTDAFTKAAEADTGMRFVCADQRHTISGQLKQVYNLFARLGSDGIMPSFVKSCLDDRATAKYIKSFDTPSAIFYGIGHFKRLLRNEGEYSMRALLPEGDKPMCVLDIKLHRSQKDKINEFAAQKLNMETPVPADAELYVSPSADDPNGIKIMNPDLQPLYDEAVRIVQARDADSIPSRPSHGRPSP